MYKEKNKELSINGFRIKSGMIKEVGMSFPRRWESVNNEINITGFSGRADACRRMTGEINACRRMTEEINACRRMTEEINACRRMTKEINACRRMTEKISTLHRMTLLCLLTGCILLTSSVTLAEETTTTEPCANGAGTVFIGAVSGRKYCVSNHSESQYLLLNWWNANAWCDALGMRLFDLNKDCYRSGTTSIYNCPEANGTGVLSWTATPISTGEKMCLVEHHGNQCYYAVGRSSVTAGKVIHALCAPK